MRSIKLIDLFAGPGGLGEGFSRLDNYERFDPTVSVEMDQIAAQTLKLRKFFRIATNQNGSILKNFYQLPKGSGKLQDQILASIDIKTGEKLDLSVWHHELGTLSPDKTYEEINSRLNKLDPKKSECVLIGGPPCQAYSISGRSRRSKMEKEGAYIPKKDERHFLYQQYLGLLPKFRPAIFIMENVPGILSSKMNGEPIFERILDDLRNIDGIKYELFPLTKQYGDLFNEYEGKDFQINSANFGIPQARKRVIIMGVRHDLLTNNLSPGHLEESEPVSIEKMIGAMPNLRSGISKVGGISARDTLELWKKEVTGWHGYKGSIKDHEIKTLLFDEYVPKIKDSNLNRGGEYVGSRSYKKSGDSLPKGLKEWIIDEDMEGYINSSTRSHMNTDLKRYLYNSVYSEIHGKAPLLSDVPEELLPNHKNKNQKIHQDRFRTLVSDKPSKTITSHISKDGHAFIHYDPLQCRSLTVREAARIQTFPDNYFFCGNRTQQYHQVGNAVPPYLANQIAKIVSDFLGSSGL